MNKRRPLKNLAKIALFLATFSTSASASDFRLGVALGIGGAGIDKIVAVNGVDTTVHRSEGPGTFTLFLDYLLSERISVAFEHSRGLRLGPFSSGVSFTGIATRIF